MTMGTTVSNMTSLLSGTTDELDLEQEEFDPRKVPHRSESPAEERVCGSGFWPTFVTGRK